MEHLPPLSPPATRLWAMTHKAWNALCHALWGSTTELRTEGEGSSATSRARSDLTQSEIPHPYPRRRPPPSPPASPPSSWHRPPPAPPSPLPPPPPLPPLVHPPPIPLAVARTWALTHKAWNALCHALWGNTSKRFSLDDVLQDGLSDDAHRTGKTRYMAVHGGPRAGVYDYVLQGEQAYRDVDKSNSKGYATFEEAITFAATGVDPRPPKSTGNAYWCTMPNTPLVHVPPNMVTHAAVRRHAPWLIPGAPSRDNSRVTERTEGEGRSATSRARSDPTQSGVSTTAEPHCLTRDVTEQTEGEGSSAMSRARPDLMHNDVGRCTMMPAAPLSAGLSLRGG